MANFFHSRIGILFDDSAHEFIEAAREFLTTEMPHQPISDAQLVSFFTQNVRLIVAVFDRISLGTHPLVCQATTHFHEKSAPKMLSGIIATIVLNFAQHGVTRPDEQTTSAVLAAMRRATELPTSLASPAHLPQNSCGASN